MTVCQGFRVMGLAVASDEHEAYHRPERLLIREPPSLDTAVSHLDFEQDPDRERS